MKLRLNKFGLDVSHIDAYLFPADPTKLKLGWATNLTFWCIHVSEKILNILFPIKKSLNIHFPIEAR